jgi:hypothetical protein
MSPCGSLVCVRLERPPCPPKPPPLLLVLENDGCVGTLVAAALEGPDIEAFCRPVAKFLNTSAKLDGVFLVSGVCGGSFGDRHMLCLKYV